MVDRDFEKYWKSISEDLQAVKNRVRDLIGDAHWLTEGTYKEIILGNVIKSHLPENLKVCTGFVCKENNISTQIDLLIIDKSGFTLFKEGDLVIVTPSVVRAILEVKTRLQSKNEMKEALKALSKNVCLIEQTSAQRTTPFWAGLFVFEGSNNADKQLLEALNEAEEETGGHIDCVAYGTDVFIRFWQDGELGSRWVSYHLGDLVAGYFIGNIIAALTLSLSFEDGPVLFPIEGTKETRRKYYLKRGDGEVKAF